MRKLFLLMVAISTLGCGSQPTAERPDDYKPAPKSEETSISPGGADMKVSP